MQTVEHFNVKNAALKLPELPYGHFWVITEDRDKKGYGGNLYVALWRSSLQSKFRLFKRNANLPAKHRVVTTKLVGDQLDFMATANLIEAIETTAGAIYTEQFPPVPAAPLESAYVGIYTAG